MLLLCGGFFTGRLKEIQMSVDFVVNGAAEEKGLWNKIIEKQEFKTP